MALTFHRTHRHHDSSAPVPLPGEGVAAFRTAEGEVIHLEGASPDEVAAKADDFLAWAS